MSTYHTPVLLDECIAALNIIPDGIYVDATFGAGGHSLPILKHLDVKGHLFGFDKDSDAKQNAPVSDKFTFVQSDYRYLSRFMEYYNVPKVNGILADLGVSSHQLDESVRGFAYRFDSLLDMRMNTEADVSAIDVINTYDVAQLVAVFSEYGELRNSKQLANRIVSARKQGAIKTTDQLLQVIRPIAFHPFAKYFAQVFQAIRIEVNDEMNGLHQFLESTLDWLPVGGRLVVLTYHSIEDRIVKRFMKTGRTDGKLIKDAYGVPFKPFKLVNRQVIVPSEEEQETNPRSRSAKLRIAERVDE